MRWWLSRWIAAQVYLLEAGQIGGTSLNRGPAPGDLKTDPRPAHRK
jgi:hypothetical protein